MTWLQVSCDVTDFKETAHIRKLEEGNTKRVKSFKYLEREKECDRTD